MELGTVLVNDVSFMHDVLSARNCARNSPSYHSLWPIILLLIVYGVTLQYRTLWIEPVIGMAMGSFGLQLITTMAYTYCSDGYRPQSAELGG